MKKILSALTALCMCASMTTGVLPASALNALSPADAVIATATEGYTWKIADETFDPNTQKSVKLPITVYNDPGTYGVQFHILIDGKSIADADSPFTLYSAKSGGGYKRIQSVLSTADTGIIALAIAADESDPNNVIEDEQCADGEAAITMTFAPKEGVTYTPGTVYKVEFDVTSKGDDNEAIFANAAKESLLPSLTLEAGSITIPGGETTPTDVPTDAPTDAPTKIWNFQGGLRYVNFYG